MKVLWIVNSVLPKIASDCNIKCGVGGGWLTGIADSLILDETVNLIVCFPHGNDTISGVVGRIKYYSFGTCGVYKYCKNTENRIKEIIETEQPDVIHIFGTEFPHSLAAINAAERCGLSDNTVVSIQGLVSIYAKHFFADLPKYAVRRYTLRDFLKRDNIISQRNKFIKRGVFEIKALKKAKNVIGRTSWDEACVKTINDKVNYFFCNETLRNEFYDEKWNYETSEKHSVFVGSCSYPIKGFHCVLEQMPEILKRYPDAKVYVPGESPFTKNGIKGLRHKTYYRVYLKRLIEKYRLKDKVVFLGNLTAEEMKEQMLRSNIYILSSSIENSPNTLGEAMLLGVPCIAADVGGVTDMATDKKDALIYPFEESYMLPYYVGKIFDNVEFAEKLSESARAHATITHSKEKNYNKLLSIYRKLT